MKLFGASAQDIESAAAERWEIAPASTRYVQPAKFLPGQIERIRKTEFGYKQDVIRELVGGFDTTELATVGFRLLNVDLVDGVLYASRALRHLRPRRSRAPVYAAPREIVTGSMYESWIGNRWFGSWMLGDCLTYPLAEQIAQPFTTTLSPSPHQKDYESLLGMRPTRISNAHFEELTIFQDASHNADKRKRGEEFRRRIVVGEAFDEHPGVYLIRGNGGDRRILTNERELAERLATRRGFRVLDPLKSSLPEIIRACAGARIVAGVEGSHLVHGLMLMPPTSTLFVIQPPDRVISVLKPPVDRHGQQFAFLVGSGGADELSVDLDEVERTLDLVD